MKYKCRYILQAAVINCHCELMVVSLQYVKTTSTDI